MQPHVERLWTAFLHAFAEPGNLTAVVTGVAPIAVTWDVGADGTIDATVTRDDDIERDRDVIGRMRDAGVAVVSVATFPPHPRLTARRRQRREPEAGSDGARAADQAPMLAAAERILRVPRRRRPIERLRGDGRPDVQLEEAPEAGRPARHGLDSPVLHVRRHGRRSCHAPSVP